MAKLEIHQFPCLSDNYGVLIHDAGRGRSRPRSTRRTPRRSLARLKAKGWKLTHMLTTHHHGDHTGGNLQLKDETGAPSSARQRGGAHPGHRHARWREGDVFTFGNFEIKVLDTPGHTLGHVTYFIPAAKVAFVGDTLFAMGGGRIFEGNAEMMWKSLQKLMALPTDTEIYCGHEYTQSNANFALTSSRRTPALQKRAKEVDRLREEGKPTLPTRLDSELETNPFLRPHVAAIRASSACCMRPTGRCSRRSASARTRAEY